MARTVYNPQENGNRIVRHVAAAELERLLAMLAAPDFRGKAAVEIGAKDGRLFGPKVTIQRITTVARGSSEDEPSRD